MDVKGLNKNIIRFQIIIIDQVIKIFVQYIFRYFRYILGSIVLWFYGIYRNLQLATKIIYKSTLKSTQ